MNTVSIELPDEVTVTLRGHARKLATAILPAKTLVWLVEKGIQRGANDPLGAVFAKGAEVPAAEVDKYWTELLERWEKGEVQKTRTGGLGRTTDPVQREVKRLAKEEVQKNITVLLAHHGNISKKEFAEKFEAKYVAARIEKHRERLESEAKANLAKVSEGAEAPVELLDIDDEPAEADESEGGDESEEENSGDE